MRYEDANTDVISIFNQVLTERFHNLSHLNFKLIFDTKRRMKSGQIVLASIEVTSLKLKFFTATEDNEYGYDCIIVIDKKAWELSNEKDKIRLISHELRHIFLDEQGNPKIVGHEISDFYAEIALNVDDQEWAHKLSTLVFDVYEQEKDVVKGSVI